MKTHIDHSARAKTQRLAELEKKTAELERKLSDARESLDRELAHYGHPWDRTPDDGAETLFDAADNATYDSTTYDNNGYDHSVYDSNGYDSNGYDHNAHDDGAHDNVDDHADGWVPRLDVAQVDRDAAPVPVETDGDGLSEADFYSPEARTATLINRGRPSAMPRRLPRRVKIGAAVVFGLVLLLTIIALMVPGPGPAWPISVARVQAEVAKACQNPDVSSEPDQVNFACGKDTRQILWVFALLTSGNNPTWAEAGTGRQGLEPITPQQGGVVAWSLNLHHPYNPSDPIDSLEVAARAINNIVGGATVTGTYGRPVIQQGLEGHPSNCLRYTGSDKVNSHKGFPGLCARPVSSPAGQAALVEDIYQRWVPGAGPKAAQNAATLFANAKNPASPQVQAILKQLPNPVR